MIIIKAPDQDLFDMIYTLSKKLGFDTYDHLPLQNEPVKYPFVNIGDVQKVNVATSTRGLGTLHITIHFWGNQNMRKRLSEMQEALFLYASTLRNMQFYTVAINRKGSDSEMVGDTSVPNTFLWHGTLNLEYRLT